MFGECSRLVCDDTKRVDDGDKLWREQNDGLYWVNKGCKLNVDEFGILGFQVAGKTFNLYVLIRDSKNISRHFLLRSVEIPTQPTGDAEIVFKFMEALLFLRVCITKTLYRFCYRYRFVIVINYFCIDIDINVNIFFFLFLLISQRILIVYLSCLLHSSPPDDDDAASIMSSTVASPRQQ
jgi:hypothetical protein